MEGKYTGRGLRMENDQINIGESCHANPVVMS